jgi:hypothetical protein
MLNDMLIFFSNDYGIYEMVPRLNTSMRANQILTEIFTGETPCKVKWETKDSPWAKGHSTYSGIFVTPSNNKYEVQLSHDTRYHNPPTNKAEDHRPEWNFGFGEYDPQKDNASRMQSGKNTDQFAVYGTVISVLRKFLKDVNPTEIAFYAWTRNQETMYTKFVGKFKGELESLGYKVLSEFWLGTRRYYLVRNDIVHMHRLGAEPIAENVETDLKMREIAYKAARMVCHYVYGLNDQDFCEVELSGKTHNGITSKQCGIETLGFKNILIWFTERDRNAVGIGAQVLELNDPDSEYKEAISVS